MKLRLAVALAATLGMPGLAPAQEAGPPSVRDLPASTRAMALGGAYMMDSGHADALFYHPALIDGAGGFGLDVQRWGDGAASAAASAAMGWYGGGVAVGLSTLQYEADLAGVQRGQDALFAQGGTAVSELIAGVGYARTLFGVRVGLAGKLVERRTGDVRGSAALVDAGVAHDVGPFTAGLTIQDVGDAPLDEDDGVDFGRVVLGVGAYGRQVGPLDVGVAGAVTYTSDETVAGAGLELGYWPIVGRTFLARVGVQRVPEGSEASPLTLGLAYWGDDLVLEWAYRDFGDLDEGTHRFGVRWR
ncbi:MAG TPA: hypothetical protein VK849_09605 [Longimicrobiales bacterium]|nr:hypothetical protein [Longimicrobiales bacterium]